MDRSVRYPTQSAHYDMVYAAYRTDNQLSDLASIRIVQLRRVPAVSEDAVLTVITVNKQSWILKPFHRTSFKSIAFLRSSHRVKAYLPGFGFLIALENNALKIVTSNASLCPLMEMVIMSIRLTTTLAVCREVALPALVLVLVLANEAVGANIFAAAPFKNYPVQLLTASVEAVSPSQNSVDDTDEQSVPEPPHFLEEVANASPELATKAAYSPSVDSESINATSTSTGSVLMPASQIVVPEVSMQRGDARDVGDQCIDSYLWSLYLVTPKQDTIKVRALKKVTIKRNGERVAAFRSSSTA